MKIKTTHNILRHLILLALFAGASFAFAQTEELITNTVDAEGSIEIEADVEIEAEQTTTTEVEQETGPKVKPETVKVSGQANAGARIKLQTQAKKRITNLAANMSNRIEASIARIQNIIDRTESRINKLETNGKNTTKASASLASAQVSVDAAVAVMTNIDQNVANAISSEDVRTTWSKVKSDFTTARDHLKAALSDLRTCVKELKNANNNTQTETEIETSTETDAEISE